MTSDAPKTKSKRTADTYLTDQNWDQQEEEEEPQETGPFSAANEEILSKRVIKKAKRRVKAGEAKTSSDSTEEKKGGLFAGFSGFGGASAAAPPSMNKPPAAATFGGFSFQPPTTSTTDEVKTSAPIAQPFSFANKTAEPAAQPFNFGSKTSESAAKPFSFSSGTAPAASAPSSFWSSSTSDNKSDFFLNRGPAKEAVKLFGTEQSEKPVASVVPSEKKLTANGTNTGEDKQVISTQSATDEKKTNGGSVEINNNAKKDASDSDKGKDSVYMSRLASLNVSVSTWITQHVAKNPCIDLTPIFKDYKRHLADLDNLPSKTSKTSDNHVSTPAVSSGATSSGSFKTPENQPSQSEPGVGGGAGIDTFPGTLFAPKPASAAIFASTPISSAGALPSQVPKFSSSMFSPSMFAPSNNKPAAVVAPATVTGETADEDAPPKVEPTAVTESGSFYNVRCKLFYKVDNEYIEKGIGMLFLKPVDEDSSDRVNMIVRLETATATIMLNIIVATDTPIARAGKNNITLIAVPNPPVFTKKTGGDNSKPLTYLIRVKGQVEADALFAKIKEKCGGA